MISENDGTVNNQEAEDDEIYEGDGGEVEAKIKREFIHNN